VQYSYADNCRGHRVKRGFETLEWDYMINQSAIIKR